MGKSGSGKSVLIKCIVGLLRPDSGTLKVFEKPVLELNHQELDEIREKIVQGAEVEYWKVLERVKIIRIKS